MQQSLGLNFRYLQFSIYIQFHQLSYFFMNPVLCVCVCVCARARDRVHVRACSRVHGCVHRNNYNLHLLGIRLQQPVYIPALYVQVMNLNIILPPRAPNGLFLLGFLIKIVLYLALMNFNNSLGSSNLLFSTRPWFCHHGVFQDCNPFSK